MTLSSVQRLSLSCLAWDTVSPEFEEFVLHVKVCPLPRKCLDLGQCLIRAGASPTYHLELQGLIHDYMTGFQFLYQLMF